MNTERTTQRKATVSLDRPKTRKQIEAWILEGLGDTAIAQRLGVSRPTVWRFRKRHEASIAPVVAQVEQRIIDVAAKDKEERIRRYAGMIDRIEALVEERGGLEAVDVKWVGGAEFGREVEVRRFDAALVGKWHDLHREIADELGSIPRQSDVSVNVNIGVAVALAWSDGSPA